MNDERHIFEGTMNGHPVCAIAFVYRGKLDPKDRFRWGVRLRFARVGGEASDFMRFEILPRPPLPLSKAVAYVQADEFLFCNLGLQRTPHKGKPESW